MFETISLEMMNNVVGGQGQGQGQGQTPGGAPGFDQVRQEAGQALEGIGNAANPFQLINNLNRAYDNTDSRYSPVENTLAATVGFFGFGVPNAPRD
jgi:hypothetical protein